MVVNFFTYVAEETREWLAKLGVRSLERADRPPICWTSSKARPPSNNTWT